jgi:PilZ domain
MFTPQRAAPRHLFLAPIQLTDVQSEKQLAAHTKDLNLFGCFVETMSPFPQGTKVRLRISRANAHVTALGRVANSRPNAGMGIIFITIEPSSFPVLDGWLASLRE